MTLVYPQLRARTTLGSEKARDGTAMQFKEIGRRNWTRTNDPHHVKVVL